MMARAVEDIEKDIRALSLNDKEMLCFQLMDELDVVPPELEALAKEFRMATEKTLNALRSAAESFDGREERLEAARKETREEMLQSGEEWPFPIPHEIDLN